MPASPIKLTNPSRPGFELRPARACQPSKHCGLLIVV